MLTAKAGVIQADNALIADPRDFDARLRYLLPANGPRQPATRKISAGGILERPVSSRKSL